MVQPNPSVCIVLQNHLVFCCTCAGGCSDAVDVWVGLQDNVDCLWHMGGIVAIAKTFQAEL